jgi:formate/nitrite transporter FocA (FNT family)
MPEREESMAAVMVSPGRASAERRFFTGMALAILATIIVGFSRSFFLRPLFPEWPSPSEMIFYVHGVAFTAWIVLLVVLIASSTQRTS